MGNLIKNIFIKQKHRQLNDYTEQYKKNKVKINRLIFLSVMSQLMEADDSKKWCDEIRESSQLIKSIQDNLRTFFEDSLYKKNIQNEQQDYIQFLHFKLTYFFSPDEKYETIKCSQQMKELIEFLKNLKVQLKKEVIEKVQEIQVQLKNDADQEIDYENCIKPQGFTALYKRLKKDKYSDYFKKFQLQGLNKFQLNGLMKSEQQFLTHLMDCYNIYGNMQMIEQYRPRKLLLYFQVLNSFYEPEQETNIFKEYEISQIKYFDKYSIFEILLDSNYIDKLEEDEIYLYFLIFTLLHLVKMNYMVDNKEHNLQKLITKIQKLENPKFKLGYIFLLKLMFDLKEKSCLSEDESNQDDDLINRSTVSLFKSWSKEKYLVSDCYFNKNQLQLYIDGFQSVLILSILPDLVRFYDINEPLPYQPTEIEIGYIQQIIRGKRLFQKNIDELKELMKNIKEITKEETYDKEKQKLERTNVKNNANEQMVEYNQFNHADLQQRETCILPDLVRFYGINEPLPYQPTEIEIGYIQQIIRGKRLFQKYIDELKFYFEELMKNIMEITKKETYDKEKQRLERTNVKNNSNEQMLEYNQFNHADLQQREMCFHYKVCEVNLQTLKIIQNSLKKDKQNESTVNQNNEENNEITKRKELLISFLQTVDASQYYNVKRKRQIYHTLSSLFIDEEKILEEIILLIKESKNPLQVLNESQFFNNLIVSLKQEFDINNLININSKDITFNTQSNSKVFFKLFEDFIKAQESFEQLFEKFEDKYLEDDLNQTEKEDFLNKLIKNKQQFSNLIDSYGFLKWKKYNSLYLNIKIYETQIDLIIDYIKPNSNNKHQDYKKFYSLSENCQFEVIKVKTSQGIFVIKQVPKDKNKKLFIKQQIREISILSNLPENNYIIKYVKRQLNSQKQFQLFLEYFEGKTLQSYKTYITEKEKNLKEINNDQEEKKRIQIEKLKICIEILKATNFLHQKNIIHGDLKLSNILLLLKDNQIQIKIIDFSESGFMIEETMGYTQGYEDKSNFQSKYQDYVSIGVILIQLLYFPDFKYICDCVQNGQNTQKKQKQYEQCQNIKLHKKEILKKYKDEFKQTKNNYQYILFKQIKTLFNDQPFLRCSLTELIHLMELQILNINKDTTYEEQLAKFYEKYGEIEFNRPKGDEIYPNKDYLPSPSNSFFESQYSDAGQSPEEIDQKSAITNNSQGIYQSSIKIIEEQKQYVQKVPISDQIQDSNNKYFQENQEQNDKQSKRFSNDDDQTIRNKDKKQYQSTQKNFVDNSISIDINEIQNIEGHQSYNENEVDQGYNSQTQLLIDISNSNINIQKKDDQNLSQLTDKKSNQEQDQLQNLENYFINQKEQAMYPRIFQKLKKIEFDFRKHHISLLGFSQLITSDKLKKIAKIFKFELLQIFAELLQKFGKDIIKILFSNNKKPIEKNLRNKIIDYYLDYEQQNNDQQNN
ncbi:hypothetical protein ABPG73_002908 [Tetrahymena malaccensis]